MRRRRFAHAERPTAWASGSGLLHSIETSGPTLPTLRGEGPTTIQAENRNDTADGDGRLPAGAELHEPAGSWRHPQSRDDAHSADYYQEIAPHARGGQVPHRVLRRPPGDARPLRQRPCPHRRVRHPRHQDGPADRADDHGRGDEQARPRLDLLDHLLRAVRRGPPVFHPRPDDRRPRRLERRHLGQRRRGANMGHEEHLEHDLRYDRPTSSWAWCSATGIPGTTAAIIIDKTTGRLRRPDQGEAARPQGQVLHLARAVHRAALAAGPPGHHPGRRQRPRPALRRALGRGDLCRRPQHRAGQGRLRCRQGRGGAAWPRSRPHLHLQHPHPGRRRHQGRGRGQDGD